MLKSSHLHCVCIRASSIYSLVSATVKYCVFINDERSKRALPSATFEFQQFFVWFFIKLTTRWKGLNLPVLMTSSLKHSIKPSENGYVDPRTLYITIV